MSSTKNHAKACVIGVAILLVSSTLLVLYLFNGVSTANEDLSADSIKPQTPHYLVYSSGNESKIFLLSAEPSYGYWTQNDTHMDWFSNGPIIHKGDPVFVVNSTVRNDYTQNDKAGVVSAVNSYNHSEVSFAVKLYDKNNNTINALQAYPRVDTRLGSNVFSFERGRAEPFELYFATANRNIDHFEIVVLYVSSMPPP
ncbi:MAG: hypothetical protein NWF05_02455 [Candidatus Bathyarchaeota archaeon]|nr:hypothetical protein [Candidatus Bathyarchaeota archaeon]